jgi:hypothetical protein
MKKTEGRKSRDTVPLNVLQKLLQQGRSNRLFSTKTTDLLHHAHEAVLDKGEV